MTAAYATGSVADRYRAALSSVDPGGRLTEFELTGYDRTGVPVTATVWDPASPGAGDAHGVGYGATAGAARIGALGELAERMLLRPAITSLPVRRAGYRELLDELGPDGVTDPVSLVLEAGSAYSPDRPLDWVPALRWRTGEPVLVPVEFAAFDATSLPACAPPGGWLTTAITNGLGAGDTLERAVAHGLLELVQRDGDTVSFRALDQGVVLDLDTSTDPGTRAIVDGLRSVGITPMLKLASTEFACVVYCLGDDDDEDVPPIALSAIGEAADPDRDAAIRKALLEFASSRARRIFAFGPIEQVARRNPDYWREELARPVEAQEHRALETMRTWTGWDTEAMRTALAPMVLERQRLSVASLPTSPALQPPELLDQMLHRLRHFDVLVVPSTSGVHAGGEPRMVAAKVIAPGLEVETLSYLRIGERVARVLLERGSELVGRGPADRPERLQVHLDPAATERLGGPVWLDRVAVERTVAGLYPLYREPRRHAVARTADR